MTIRLDMTEGTVKVIARIDDSLNVSDKEYQDYLETLDEAGLRFHEGKEPTRFILKKVLPWEVTQSVRAKALSMKRGLNDDSNEEAEISLDLGYQMEECRHSLVDIENPTDTPEEQKVKFVMESGGGASKELFAKLRAVGVADNLVKARQSVLKQRNVDGVKKK